MRPSNMGNSMKPSKTNSMVNHLYYEFMVVPTSKYSQMQRSQRGEVDEYRSTRANARQTSAKENLFGMNLVQEVLKATSQEIFERFQNEFAYGVDMDIWRKGRIKRVVVFMDPNFPSLLWISSKTKSFLFDLTFTTISRSDYEIQLESGVKEVIVLQYFEESLPFLFRSGNVETTNRYFELFNSFITYNRLTNSYPPYFSRIIKLYTMEESKETAYRKKRVDDILKVSASIGMSDQVENRAVLGLILARKKQISSELLAAELTDMEISDYFRITHCNDSLKAIFQQYSSQRLQSKLDYLQQKLKKKDFLRFLQQVQGETKQFIAQIGGETKERLSFYDFCAYLENDKNNYVATVDNFDESLPITDYYCYSSHNTYLSGNQLTSDSKVDRYLEDLEGGLKCVEIDVHNDGERPIITHAFNDKSLCKPIDFEETICQIAKFCDSHLDHYPIILSIENHAKDENRYKMMNVLMKYLNDKIFYIDKEHPNDVAKVCRSLAQLKGKVIIKTDARMKDIMDFRKKSLFSEASSIRLALQAKSPVFPSQKYTSRFGLFQRFVREQQERKLAFEKKTPKNLFLPVAEMTKITGLFKSTNGIENSESGGYECTSLTSEKTEKVQEQKLVEYTKRSFLRVYPVATEIGSSNYNPLHCLKTGAQIIALNTQTKDNHAWLMMSFFTAGRLAMPAKLGYVQKPPHLRSNSPKPNIEKTVSVQVCSKQPVAIKFFGTEGDMKRNKGVSSSFTVRDHLEAFLMFSIGEKLKDCVPLRFMRGGYRVLVAKNELYRDSGIRVLVFISIKEASFDI